MTEGSITVQSSATVLLYIVPVWYLYKEVLIPNTPGQKVEQSISTQKICSVLRRTELNSKYYLVLLTV